MKKKVFAHMLALLTMGVFALKIIGGRIMFIMKPIWRIIIAIVDAVLSVFRPKE